MTIERDNENIIIKIDASLVDIDTVQQFIDYFRLLESNAQNKGSQQDADDLALEIHKNRLTENRRRVDLL